MVSNKKDNMDKRGVSAVRIKITESQLLIGLLACLGNSDIDNDLLIGADDVFKVCIIKELCLGGPCGISTMFLANSILTLPSNNIVAAAKCYDTACVKIV